MAVLSFKAKPVTKEQFEEFNKAVHEDYRVGNPTETSGTIQDHSATVDYKYDEEKQEVLFNIEKVHRGFFEKVDPEQVKENLMNFLNEVTSGDHIEAVDPEEPEPEPVPPVEEPVNSAPEVVKENTEELKTPEPLDVNGANLNPPTTETQTNANTGEVKPFTPKV